MQPLSLTEPPAALTDAARERWSAEPNVDPAPGQLWLLSWDGEAPVAAVLTVVRDDYVLAMPVSFEQADAGSEEALTGPERLGAQLVIWYRLETGLGAFLLHRYIGVAATDGEVLALRRGTRGESVPQFDAGHTSNLEALRTLATTFTRLCHIEWPSETEGDVVLDRDTLAAAGINARIFAERTGLPTATALSLWTGETTLTPEQARLVTDTFANTVDHALAVPKDWITESLRDPRVKDGVLQVAAHTGAGERAARDLIRSNFALAARTPSVADRRRTAIRDAIALILEE
jgi:hypothetical protein